MTLKSEIWKDNGLNPNSYSRAVALAMEDYADKKAEKLLTACKEFVRKVECGEARSKKSYMEMKEAISKFNIFPLK